MQKPISKTTFYVTGTARDKNMIYVIGEDRGLKNSNEAHSRNIAFDQGNFYHSGDRNWTAVGVGLATVPSTKLITIGEDGDVFTYAKGNAADELMDPRPICLRNLKIIEGFAFACGMRRQVYCRKNENTWEVMNAPEPTGDKSTGFEAIAGFSVKEIYAVGWSGEIWQHDGNKWSQHKSPTNLVLTGLSCAGDGQVYICGQQGTVITGRNNQWTAIDLKSFPEDFWDIHWFNDKIYLATMTGLYTYTPKEGLLPVNFGSDAPSSCYRLTSAENVLWSVGSSDIFSFNGTQWTRVD